VKAHITALLNIAEGRWTVEKAKQWIADSRGELAEHLSPGALLRFRTNPVGEARQMLTSLGVPFRPPAGEAEARALEVAFIRFSAAVMGVAEEYNASCEGEESIPFRRQLFDEYNTAVEPKPEAHAWLRPKLAGAFQYLLRPPVWIEEEASWPFLDGRPMTFISQSEIVSNDVAERSLNPGDVLYVFGGRRWLEREKAWTIEYRVVVQNRHFAFGPDSEAPVVG
jgi:hypothetical protein